MRRGILVAACCLAAATPATAQTSVAELGLPELTTEQNWNRASWQLAVAWATTMSYARSHGQTLEDMARHWVGIFGPSWESAGRVGPAGLARAMYRNQLMWPGGTMEFTTVSPTRIEGWFNHPWRPAFGAEGQLYGTTVGDWDVYLDLFMSGIARHVDLTYESHTVGERTTFAISGSRAAGQ
jgi:hypothetical protein